MNDNNNNFIRVINIHTGEVRETSSTITGIKALSNVLDREIESYKLDFYEGRDIEQDIVFEGHPFFTKLLEKEFEQKIKKV